ncbi:MAG: dTDP-4-dehydrorhamnose reductase [Methanoregula sp.]|nr:dTDP-4-dehydrorhamnose reductase [Methanoregula sp.]
METIKEINPHKIVIFGANGMLGHALQRVFPKAHFFGHRDVEITNENTVKKILKRERPAVIINAAAYTDVDACEDNRDHAFAVNGDGPGYIASACSETEAILVHYSTDYIFDGTKKEYREDDLPNPLNIYGKSKLLGEVSIQNNMENYRIIRTSWLFGSHGRNFVDTILSLSRQVPDVRVVNDQIGKPTYTTDLAQATPDIIRDDPGIYHITNDGQCSWYEFASSFIPNAIPCTSAEFPRKAQRPVYSVLANTKTPPLRHWREAVREYILTKRNVI